MFSLSPWKLWAKSSSLLQASNNSRSHRDILELLYSCTTGWLRIEEQHNSGKRWEKLNWCCSDSNPPEVNEDFATRKGRWSRGWQEGQNRAWWSNSRGWSGLESTRKRPAQGYLHFFWSDVFWIFLWRSRLSSGLLCLSRNCGGKIPWNVRIHLDLCCSKSTSP